MLTGDITVIALNFRRCNRCEPVALWGHDPTVHKRWSRQSDNTKARGDSMRCVINHRAIHTLQYEPYSPWLHRCTKHPNAKHRRVKQGGRNNATTAALLYATLRQSLKQMRVVLKSFRRSLWAGRTEKRSPPSSAAALGVEATHFWNNVFIVEKVGSIGQDILTTVRKVAPGGSAGSRQGERRRPADIKMLGNVCASLLFAALHPLCCCLSKN